MKGFSMKIFLTVFTVTVIVFLFSTVFAQEQKNELSGTVDHPSFAVKKSSSPIQTDGILNEIAWQEATVIKVPYEYLPGDNVQAPVETDFMITFDEKHLYMAFRCFVHSTAPIYAPSLPHPF